MTLTGQPSTEYGSIEDPLLASVSATRESMEDMTSREYAETQAQSVLHTAQSWGKQGLEGLSMMVSHTDGVSRFCLLGGLAVVITSGLDLFNVFAVISPTPIEYLLNAYCFVFGIVTMLLEANPDDLEFIPAVASWVRKYQDLTYDYCKLLTLSWARGLFYLFMGSALIAMWHILSSLVGLW
eukprot:CAMPEP_0174283662 /NCGR_PEP_ID=MMETSP0809-20121228/4378_1 /TAXON_ID=73025 ORGANISM="Eutreptiella gymnastica-like, Strain CCMP1594" /NCGR_SAMPLE_ID=MMETSP0809 /ASSEMBLY_ACC=CAM_ASM_000658 /LENGTH=181 /DNA_ID=CAMNT_0015378737 /DNA_START=33 /DNA_END=575 /DNA_ORIENTATION=-